MLFTGVGVIGTAAHYLTLITLVQLTGLNAVLASSTGAVAGAIVNYILNYYYTFQSKKRHHEAAVKFFTVAGVGFILNGLIMQWGTVGLGFHYLIAQLVATGCI